MSDTICTVTIDDRDYDVARAGDVLRVTPSGSEELAETVALSHLPEDARKAVEDNDYDNAALQQAAEGIAAAIANRGG